VKRSHISSSRNAVSALCNRLSTSHIGIWASHTLTVTVTGFADQYRATLDQAKAAQQPALSGVERARFAVPGSVPITSQSEHRTLLVKLGGEPEQEFVLKLPPSPRKEDEAWSEWIGPHNETASLPVAKEREFALRYRVQPD
jgi:hypothetical protein